MPDKPDNVKVYIAEKDIWHGRHGYKAIFARFNNFEVTEGSK